MATNSNTINEITPSVIVTGSTQRLPNAPLSETMHDTIIAKRATGSSISQIARDLGTTRNTVKRHLKNMDIVGKANQVKLSGMIPDALSAISKSLKAGDGKLALLFLERMNAFAPQPNDNKGDTSLTVAINTLIQSNSPAPAPTPHPSGHEGEGDDLSLRVRGQNSPKLELPVAKIVEGESK